MKRSDRPHRSDQPQSLLYIDEFKASITMVMPLALLEKNIDKRISLLLKDGRVLEGKLTGYDEYMNMVLDETSERTTEGEERRLGTVVLRGNNVVSIALV